MKNTIITAIILGGALSISACTKAQPDANALPVTAVTQTAEQHAVPATEQAPINFKTKITHVNAVESSAWVKTNPETIVLDIRTPKEFNAGHIEGAINVDFYANDFADQLANLDLSKDYVMHCRSGGRSSRSLKTFKKLGFKHIVHMDGGMLAWQKAGLPTVN